MFTLRTKPITAAPEPHDGLRISVMSRHTLVDGVTADPEIDPALYHEHWLQLAPPAHLAAAYYRGELAATATGNWAEFERRFNALLKRPTYGMALSRLRLQLMRRDVTLLGREAAPHHCHRRLVAEACRRLDPRLTIVIA